MAGREGGDIISETEIELMLEERGEGLQGAGGGVDKGSHKWKVVVTSPFSLSSEGYPYPQPDILILSRKPCSTHCK